MTACESAASLGNDVETPRDGKEHQDSAEVKCYNARRMVHSKRMTPVDMFTSNGLTVRAQAAHFRNRNQVELETGATVREVCK